MSTQEKVQSKTATYVKAATGFAGPSSLYKVNPPLQGSEYVVLSTIDESTHANSMGSLVGNEPVHETALIPATAEGRPDMQVLNSLMLSMLLEEDVEPPLWATAKREGSVEADVFFREVVGYEVQA